MRGFFSEKKKVEQVELEVIDSPLKEVVINHLNMKTTGALLLTGDWGSGKTYHIKKKIFPIVKRDTSFTPIIVSLYGETDRNAIAQKVLFAYFDNKGKKTKLNTGTVMNIIKSLTDSIPKIKNYIDVDKLLLGTGENIFKLLPHNELLICFDDMERMSTSIQIDDFLGLVNDLTENKRCKVLLIANQTVIKDGIKEKTIEKTIHFIPDLNEVLSTLIKNYDESSKFGTYLVQEKDFIFRTLTEGISELKDAKKLKTSFSNIRTIRFALEHFKIVFETIVENDEVSPLLQRQLRNIWIFILSISTEFRKSKGITFTDRKELDIKVSTLADLNIDSFKFPAQSTDTFIIDEENPDSFIDNFKEKYYKRLSEEYIFHQDVYALITASQKIDKNLFKSNLDNQFKIKEGQIHPAHELLGTIMNKGMWNYSNEEFPKVLKDLLYYCKKGELRDIVSYLNAGVYLLKFCSLFELEEEDVVKDIKEGIDVFLSSTVLNDYQLSQFKIVENHFEGENLKSIISYTKEKIKETEGKVQESVLVRLEELFQTNISEFVKMFISDRTAMNYPTTPILKDITKEAISKGIETAEPNQIMDLASLVNTRYVKTINSFQYLKEEISFLDNIKEAIDNVDTSKALFSNFFLTKELKPLVEKAQVALEKNN